MCRHILYLYIYNVIGMSGTTGTTYKWFSQGSSLIYIFSQVSSYPYIFICMCAETFMCNCDC